MSPTPFLQNQAFFFVRKTKSYPKCALNNSSLDGCDHTCQRSPARTSLICALETIPTGRNEPRLHTRRMSSSLEEKPPFSPTKKVQEGIKVMRIFKEPYLDQCLVS